MAVEDKEPRRWPAKMLTRHLTRLKITDAPEPESNEFQDAALTWDLEFRKRKATQNEVDLASRAVVAKGPGFWREQLPAILAALDEVQGTNLAQGPGGDAVPKNREEAQEASWNCPHCKGEGWVLVFHRDYDGRAIGLTAGGGGPGEPFLARGSAPCVCPLGRWVVEAHRQSSYSPKIEPREGEKIRRWLKRLDCVQDVLDGLHPDHSLEDPTLVAYVDPRGVRPTIDA